VIALRRRLERASRHPLLGPLVILLLMLLVAVTIAHGTHDQIAEEGLTCVAIAFTLVALVGSLLRRPPLLRATSVESRGPPPPLTAAIPLPGPGRTAFGPLRL
jgi:hypothetical protein